MDPAEPAAKPWREGASRLLQRATAVFAAVEIRSEHCRGEQERNDSAVGAALLSGVFAAVFAIQRGDQHNRSQRRLCGVSSRARSMFCIVD